MRSNQLSYSPDKSRGVARLQRCFVSLNRDDANLFFEHRDPHAADQIGDQIENGRKQHPQTRAQYDAEQHLVFPKCSRNASRECSNRSETLSLLEPEAGIEPATYALRVRCSTTEPLGREFRGYLGSI